MTDDSENTMRRLVECLSGPLTIAAVIMPDGQANYMAGFEVGLRVALSSPRVAVVLTSAMSDVIHSIRPDADDDPEPTVRRVVDGFPPQ